MWVFCFIFQQFFLQILWKKSWVRTLIPLQIVTVFRFTWIRVILQIFLQNTPCLLLLEHVWPPTTACHSQDKLTKCTCCLHAYPSERRQISFFLSFFSLEKGQLPGNLQQRATVSHEELSWDCDISVSHLIDRMWGSVILLFLTLMKF